MKPWYKYLPLEFATCLVETGMIKIGTLSDYQNEDQYGKDIGDKDEGSITEWSRSNHKNASQNDLNRIENKVFNILDGVKVEINNCLATFKQKSSDLYVFSTSRVFNVELMRTISRDYHKKYDACVRINNPDKFVKAISNAFIKYGKFESSALCSYMSRTKHHSKSAPHPVFLKEPKYQYQEELRAVWSPIGKEEVKSKILEIPELSKYCELYYIDLGTSTDDGHSKVQEKNFENDVVKIDLSAYNKCIFKDSEIIYCAEDSVSLDSCEFHNCQVIFSGAAERTLLFMKAIYHDFGDDGKKIVNNTFENIKRND